MRLEEFLWWNPFYWPFQPINYIIIRGIVGCFINNNQRPPDFTIREKSRQIDSAFFHDLFVAIWQ